MDVLVVKTMETAHFDDTSPSICNEKDILYLIQTRMYFLESDHSLALFHTGALQRHAENMFLIKFPFLVWSRATRSSQQSWLITLRKLEQTRSILHTLMSQFLITIGLFDYDATDKTKKWEENIEMPETRMLLLMYNHFNFADSVSSKEKCLMRQRWGMFRWRSVRESRFSRRNGEYREDPAQTWSWRWLQGRKQRSSMITAY